MKRILSLLVVLALAISMVPNVFAAKDSIDMDELLGTLVYLDSIDMIEVKLDEGAKAKTYKWTPEETGVLSLGIYDEMPEGTVLSVVMTQGENSVTYNPEEQFQMDVVAGVEVVIKVNKASEAALTFTAHGSLTPPAGTQENPVFLQDLETQVKVENAPMWFQGYFSGTTMTVTGTGAYTVTVDGQATAAVDGVVTMAVSTPNPRMPFLFTIDNAGEYTIKFEYPLGSQMNPEILFRPQYINVNMAAGNNQGYYYKWTATDAGTLKLTCPAVEGTAYDVILTNMSNYEMAWLSDSEDGTVSIEMKAGDEIIIQVAVEPDANWNYPALQTAITGEIIFPVGHQQNPEIIWDLTEINTSLAEGNSQGYYYSYFNRAAEGTISLKIAQATEGVVCDVIMTNTSTYAMKMLSESTDGTVKMDVKPGETIIIQVVAAPDANWNYPAAEIKIAGEFLFPVGSMMNPAELVIGENTAEIALGSQGYYYTWTAKVDGDLTITMPEGNWTYVLNNITAGTYGDMQWSDSEPVQKSATISVKAGDEIQLIVNTYNPEDQFVSPAGKLVVTVAFDAPYVPGDLDGVEGISEDDAVYLLQAILMPDLFELNQPVDFDKSGVVDEDDAVYLLQHVLMPEFFPL